MKTIKMDSWYLVEAIYSRSGATLGAGRCLGKDIEREKRSLRTLRPEGAADETAEGWYGRLKFVIEECAPPPKEASVDIDLDDTNAGHADALDGAFVMGVAERLGIAWALRSKVGNQNLPVYTFTGPRAALREFCRIIVPNGSFDPLGDEEPAPAPPAPQAIRKIAEELATAQELAGAAWARADILGDEASRLLRRVEEVNAQTRALRAVFEKESARAAALREVLTLLTTTTTTTTTSKESI